MSPRRRIAQLILVAGTVLGVFGILQAVFGIPLVPLPNAVAQWLVEQSRPGGTIGIRLALYLTKWGPALLPLALAAVLLGLGARLRRSAVAREQQLGGSASREGLPVGSGDVVQSARDRAREGASR